MNLIQVEHGLPPRKNLRGRKGSAFLAVVLVLAVVSAMMSLGTTKLTHAATSSTESNKISLQAQQYAVSEASFLQSLAYSDLKPVSKQSIAGSDFKKEVTWSKETTSSSTQQKTATVKIYKGDESLPRAELNLVRYNAKVSSVPIGTIIAWASTKNPTDGTWLDCNGQSCANYAELVSVLGKNTVPDYRNRFLEGNATPGKYIEAGLPNITGYIGAGWMSGTGAFKNYQYWGASGDGHGHPNTDSCSFDASRSSPIYGKSTTVQPPAATVRWLIKAA